MPFFESPSELPVATQSSTQAAGTEQFLAWSDGLAAADLDALNACREVYQALPAIQRGDTILLSHFDADDETGASCMWEYAECKPGAPVKTAGSIDEMRLGSIADLYFEAAVFAGDDGDSLAALLADLIGLRAVGGVA